MDITVRQKDAVHLVVDCDRSVAKELNQYFTFYVPNYQYTPAYKKKVWDGQIRLFNLYKHEIYVGLIDYIKAFAKDRKYTIQIESDTLESTKSDITLEDFSSFVKTLNLKFNPYPHQMAACYHSIKNGRSLLLSPTGSGKSLIIYILLRYFLQFMDSKILIIVPTIGLVNQMINDFKDYSNKHWNVDSHVHAIYSGQEKKTNKKIVVSTWQSLYNMPKEYFDEFDMVVGDECHLFKSKSLVSLMTKLKNAQYRFGTTGTLDGTNTHKLVTEGLFGTVYQVTSTKKLISKNLLSDVEIKCLVLTYPDETKQNLKRIAYQDELDFLISNEKRNDFIKKLSLSLNGNTLLLFNFVEKHGMVLKDLIEQECGDKKIFFIYGGTDADQRENIRKILSEESNAILIASYGTCSTGINIPKIENVIFASPSKSVVRVLQSIGRGLRKAENKEKTKIYDISDDISWKSYQNHTLRHLDERIKIYNNEEFPYKLNRIRI